MEYICTVVGTDYDDTRFPIVATFLVGDDTKETRERAEAYARNKYGMDTHYGYAEITHISKILNVQFN